MHVSPHTHFLKFVKHLEPEARHYRTVPFKKKKKSVVTESTACELGVIIPCLYY